MDEREAFIKDQRAIEDAAEALREYATPGEALGASKARLEAAAEALDEVSRDGYTSDECATLDGASERLQMSADGEINGAACLAVADALDTLLGNPVNARGSYALDETAAILGVEAEDTGGGNICFCFTTPSGEPFCFGWGNTVLGWSYEDGHDAGDMDHLGTAAEQAAYVREVCARLGVKLPIGRCAACVNELQLCGDCAARARA